MVISRVRDLLSGRRGRPTTTPATPEAPAAPLAAVPPPAPVRSPDGAGTDGAGGSLEDYFDRLDAALATLGPGSAAPGKPTLEPIAQPPASAPSPAASAPAPPAPSAGERTHGQAGVSDPLGGWDPDLTGGPAKPPSAPTPAPIPAAPPPVRAAEPVSFPPRVEPVAPPREPVAPPRAAAPVIPAAATTSPATGVPDLPSLADAFAVLLAAEEGHPVPPGLFAAPSAPALTEEAIDDIVSRVIARLGDESMRRAVLDAAERLVREEIDRIKRGQSA
jgi:hypothetical protein